MSSNSGANGRGAVRAAALLGLLSLVAIPVAMVVAQLRADVGLLDALYTSVPVALVLACSALVASRRARLALSRSVAPATRGLRPARFLAWAGLYVSVTAGIALVVYSVLRQAQ